MTGMYLEHYGVLGMKWGVRKEDEKRNTSSKNAKSKYLPHDYSTYSHEQAERLYTIFEAYTQQRMEKKLNELNKKATGLFGNPNANQLTPEQRDALWKEAYEETVANEGSVMTAEQQAMLAAYYALVNAGLSDYFDVVSYKQKGKLKMGFKHRDSGKVFYTMASARAYQNSAGSRTREKNVKGEPVAIKVNKDKSARGSSSGSSGYNYVSNTLLKDITKKTKIENMVKDAMQSIGKTLMSKAKR